MGKVKSKSSKYDQVIKLPVSFDKAMGVLVSAGTKKKPKRRK